MCDKHFDLVKAQKKKKSLQQSDLEQRHLDGKMKIIRNKNIWYECRGDNFPSKSQIVNSKYL